MTVHLYRLNTKALLTADVKVEEETRASREADNHTVQPSSHRGIQAEIETLENDFTIFQFRLFRPWMLFQFKSLSRND